MLIYLKGTIELIEKDFICLNVNGIGFQIFTTRNEGLVKGLTSSFFVSDFIKDEKLLLYGFNNKDELNMFNKLLTVNGVGYKTALSLLKSMTVEELVFLIKNKKIKEISGVRNVGNKASSIVFELENKLDDFISNFNYKFENVYNALISLGYKSSSIRKALKEIDENCEENEAIKIVLRDIKKYE